MGRNESRDRDNHRDNQDQVGLEQDLRLLLRIVRIGRRRGSLDIVIGILTRRCERYSPAGKPTRYLATVGERNGEFRR